MRESVVLTQRQQHDVGHSVVATGRGVLRLSSSISADVYTPTEKQLKPTFISSTYRGGRLCS
ncbi:hypothetical protein [Lysinibacillus xylanilyticus]|uniref:hypothetical protein n=1 Tax=Lysinibacillus xylanilyticus TaxID=582475 RepID=UPI0038268C65